MDGIIKTVNREYSQAALKQEIKKRLPIDEELEQILAQQKAKIKVVGAGGAGNYIVIQHKPGDSNQYRRYCPPEEWTFYFHLDQVSVQVGQWVSQGQMIGRVGKTGNASGYHLHFEIREGARYGTSFNPREYIRLGDRKDIW